MTMQMQGSTNFFRRTKPTRDLPDCGERFSRHIMSGNGGFRARNYERALMRKVPGRAHAGHISPLELYAAASVIISSRRVTGVSQFLRC